MGFLPAQCFSESSSPEHSISPHLEVEVMDQPFCHCVKQAWDSAETGARPARSETQALDPRLPTLEELSCWRARPEPHVPPGLSRELAWAWALDNFPALSRRSCQHPHFCGDGHYCACGLLRHARPGPGAGPRVERGRKRCRDPRVQAETAVELQSPQQEVDATGSAAHWGLNQPGDARASGGGQTHGHIASRSPGCPRKLQKTGA
ncbi:hypothetical protein GH733_004829 [Mirounga leonina]|nr:hypothetical protein GH733_004829 [Mirounga leonina]